MREVRAFILILQTLKLVVMMLFIFMAAGIFLCISSTFLYPTSYRGNIICNRYFSGPPFYHTTLVLRILRLLRILTSEPLLLPKSLTCLYFPYRLKNAPNIPNIRLMACHASGKSIHRKVRSYRRPEIQKSWSPGIQGLGINATPIRNSGYSFLLNGIKINSIPHLNHVLKF